MPYYETALNPKSTTSLEKTKMASEEIDPRPHKYWPSVESLKVYGQNSNVTCMFFACTSSRILRMVNICEVVDLFLQKPFWLYIYIYVCMYIYFFSSYNVWKHVQYHVLISRQPGVITQFRLLKAICIYIYMYVCICMYMCIYVYIYVYICIYIYMCAYIYIYIYMCVYMYMYIFIYMCIYIYMYIYVYINVYICVCLYIYMYIIFTQPLRSGRIWHKVNFLSGI